jgi:signal transduction histidine kinase
MISRLRRWGAFGLRGQIVGAVLVTTVVTLVVAAIVLLPQLDQSLRTASQTSLRTDIVDAKADIQDLAKIDYFQLAVLSVDSLKGTREYRRARLANNALQSALDSLKSRLGTDDVYLIGYIDPSGHGHPVALGGAAESAAAMAAMKSDSFKDVTHAFFHTRYFRPYMSFGNIDGQQMVRASIRLPDDAVLAVRKSNDEIPTAAKAVARSFEIAALAGLLLTGLLAIPLAATLARRLQRLREAAQRVAEEGTSAVVPTDRARDEVGDLSRSFAIMQRRLAHQEEARRAFVATASHELRTPLASLEGMLELVSDDLSAANPDLEEATALLERARAQSRRLSRLAADLLDLSRIDAEVPLRSEPVELGELARAVLAEFERISLERRVRLTLATSTSRDDIGDDVGHEVGEHAPVWVLADPGKIAQILRILLDNALRVAPPGSAVTIALGASGLSVIDRGPGVCVAEREVIFERFKRGSETGGQAGFGLGLAIGRELARLMGGDLTLADTPPEAAMATANRTNAIPHGDTETDTQAGATFTLALPAAEGPVSPAASEPARAGRQ